MRSILIVLSACVFMHGASAAPFTSHGSAVDEQGGAPATEVGTAPRMPISFEFATREEGQELRLADVHLVVVCPVIGKVFEGISDGPFLVATLPDGRYEVVASREGRAHRVALTVSRGEPRSVTLYW